MEEILVHKAITQLQGSITTLHICCINLYSGLTHMLVKKRGHLQQLLIFFKTLLMYVQNSSHDILLNIIYAQTHFPTVVFFRNAEMPHM
jgi:hypothetical protein